MFLKPKDLSKQAEQKESQIRIKRMEVAEKHLDVDKIRAERQKRMEIRRLTA